MNSKLYVGNVSLSAMEDDLRILFLRAGTVTSISLIKDRNSGGSKGYAFVEMSSPAEAYKAISMFNGFTLDDRQLRVNMVKQFEERGGFPGRGSGHYRHPPQRGGNNHY